MCSKNNFFHAKTAEKSWISCYFDSDVTFYPEKTQIFAELVDNLENFL